ncbi:hypothetical protein ARMSODRAFT_1065959 [Armillaria solidipes]|uniref:Alcohol oxidase n=1 Tax=Armillaria solidipes TaxID=1076256 RepID=A0A2H3APY8_9AGAR|nr:hypothetical protein ARMSODRAFT_1065959 [Armillaria solidipes]
MIWPFSSSYPTVKPLDIGVELGDVSHTSAPTFDYIVVGGGTAGCCLASRLSEDLSVTVLLESIARPFNSLPQVHADHRVILLIQGQALGGTSRVNAMFYTRGVPADFNRWRDMGHPNWSYEMMLPFFVKSENTLSHPESTFRGKNVTRSALQKPTLLSLLRVHSVKEAAEFMGIPSYTDCNDPSLPSISCVPIDIAIDRNIRRRSTYSAFLPPSIARSRQDRLKICPDAIAERFTFSSKIDGRPRAIGASREVVVCCRGIESPQLLFLSGIGPSDHLEQHGIEVIVGVGSNPEDHVDVPVMWNIPLDESIRVVIEKPLRAIFELIKYLISGRGILSDPFAHLAIFLPTRLLNENMEIVAPDSADLDSTLPQNGPDLEIKPKASRDLRMLSDPEDLAVLTKVRAQGYPIKTYHRPISDSEKDIEVRSGYHYTSTCRMAPFGDTHLEVVDDKLHVHGVDGLWVCDVSRFAQLGSKLWASRAVHKPSQWPLAAHGSSSKFSKP